MDLEYVGLGILLVAAALALCAYIWLVIVAFRQHIVWGILVVPVVTAPIFMMARWKKASQPTKLFLFALIVGLVPAALTLARPYLISFGPREKIVDGELHITLTGWDRKDYTLLKTRSDVVVLQMANEDVSNQTLDNIAGFTKLRELDLDNTAVSDEGLAIIAQLPALEILRLGKTGVTDEGFREHLMNKESLMMLSLKGTKVKSKTIREWKAAKSGRQALH